ncbi:MAG: polysaccharide biosynthesis protein [Acidimicrobiales bacterium]
MTPEDEVRRHKRDSLLRWAVRRRAMVQGGLDGLAWVAGLLLATSFRYDFELARVDFVRGAQILPLVVLLQAAAGSAFGLYSGRSRFGSFDEIAGLLRSVVLAAAFAYGFNLLADPHFVPRSAVAAGAIISLVIMAGVRYSWRLERERRRRPTGENAERLVVFGAGEGGDQVIRAMVNDPASPYLPVALLDDSPANRNLRIRGVPVVGTRAKMAATAAAYRADTLLIAIPSASPDLIGELTDLARAAGLKVKVLPPVYDIVGGRVGVGDIRAVTIADILGRHEVRLDPEGISGYLRGRRVMVTGAGGSIGSELCRQVHQLGPAELIMVDRDESALHAVQLSIEGSAPLDSPDLVLLDLRDEVAVADLFARRRPEVVFHAAALKHQPLLELYPAEALKTNVWGTLTVLEAAGAAGVSRFVNISTDKAADPSTVLGYSKRIGERLTAQFSGASTGSYLSVRFGNVLGSRGSMLGTFQAQIEAGGPVTVTHPDITRYFMTVEEAVGLVIQAGAIGRDGEVLVLDMGHPVRIHEVAERLIALAGRDVPIQITQLRPGEKLHEVLFGPNEVDHRPVHPLISHVPVPPLDADDVRGVNPSVDAVAMVAQLADLARPPLAEAVAKSP